MQKFLGESGYEPLPLAALTERPDAEQHQVAGGVISTSLTSRIHEPVEEVALRLREWYPGLPLVIATIAERKVMGRAVARKLHAALGTAGILDAREVGPRDERLGRSDHVLLLHRADLSAENGSPDVMLVLRRHLAADAGRVSGGLRGPAVTGPRAPGVSAG